MPPRSALSTLAVVALVAAVPAAVAAGPSTTAATTTDATTTVATTTVSTTTATTATTATTEPTTTATIPTTTAATTTAAATQTAAQTTVPLPVTATSSESFQRGCPVAAVAILRPGRLPQLVGPVVQGSTTVAATSRIAYPADGSIVATGSVSLSRSGCARGPAVRLASVSLFEGALTAGRVALDGAGASFSGLAVDGARRRATAGVRIPLAAWGYVVVGPPALVRVANGGAGLGALAVHLTHAHDGLPSGTVVLVSASGQPRAPAAQRARRARHARKARRIRVAIHAPLRVTPPLANTHYVFPVVGSVEYVDTYGAFRSDVPGNWHHGDDLFAPLGTPVVAVASGTINRVGWNLVGGWRVWVRDGSGDEFYYAHLAGYAPHDLQSIRVRAGEVLGFVGNTGDAFTTSPHVHFEIHPRQLLRLGYDGAVDPTTYIDHWTHLSRVHAPVPVHPPLPRSAAIRKEAVYVFRELLAARHITAHPPKPSARPKLTIPVGADGIPPESGQTVVAAAAPAQADAGGVSGTMVALVAGLGALALCAGTMLAPPVRRRWSHRDAPD